MDGCHSSTKLKSLALQSCQKSVLFERKQFTGLISRKNTKVFDKYLNMLHDNTNLICFHTFLIHEVLTIKETLHMVMSPA
jgi:hypothetical protein